MKQLVSGFHAFDIKVLARAGYLYPFSQYDWVWRTAKGTQQSRVAITVLQDSLQVVFPMGTQRVHQAIQLTYSLGPQGGKRPWFACPTCQRRVGVLYHADGLPFRCRTCCDLAYPSQYRSRGQSYGRQHRMVSNGERVRLTEQCPVGT